MSSNSSDTCNFGAPFDIEPSFQGQSIPPQNYERDVQIRALYLPSETRPGNRPQTFSLKPDVPGLRFEPPIRALGVAQEGRLRGTPTTAGTYSMTYTVTDVDGDSDTLSFTIEVAEDDEAPSFNASVSQYTFEIGTRISPLVLPEATGGDPPLTYGLSPGIPGLRFDAGVRTLTGTPTTAGTYPMTYTVTDEDGDEDSLVFTIEITSPADRTAETRHYMIYNLSAEPSLKDEVSTSCTPLPSSNWAAGSVTGEEQRFQEYRDSLWSRLGCGCCCVAKFASSAARQRSYGAIALSYSFDIPVANNYCFAGSGVGATLEEARSAALTECRENGFSSSCRIVHEKYVPPTGGS